jgi:hypothetical protein
LVFEFEIENASLETAGRFSLWGTEKTKDPHPPFAYAHSSLSQWEREKR